MFIAVININLTLQKKKCTQTTAVNHLVIVAKHRRCLSEMGEAENRFRVTLEWKRRGYPASNVSLETTCF